MQSQRETYAASSGHLEVARAPRSAIEPLEVNWLPAREKSAVVAGIVSGCLGFTLRFQTRKSVESRGARRRESRRGAGCEEGEQSTLRRGAGRSRSDERCCRSTEKFSLTESSLGGAGSQEHICLLRPTRPSTKGRVAGDACASGQATASTSFPAACS